MTVAVKMCGLRTAGDVDVAASAGARYVGFVFFAASPRNIDIKAARDLAVQVPDGIAKVALTVNADDAWLDAITDAVPLDMLQLHGQEPPERVAAVKARYGLPVMKAIGVADAPDLAAIDTYARVADQLLIDAKPPKASAIPGGNGLSFDWRLLEGRRWALPWMLAGGLTPANVAEAARLTHAAQVDVSSGIEAARGVKDPELMRAFMAAAA